MDELEKFIIQAKANCWVGNLKEGKKISPSRLGSADMVFENGSYHYHDSFVGFSDFCGQEHVALKGLPVWSMCYYGYLLNSELFDAKDAVKILTTALSKMYNENRFLGGFFYELEKYTYRDMNFGDYKRFHGIEKIWFQNTLVYELQYFGGTVKK